MDYNFTVKQITLGLPLLSLLNSTQTNLNKALFVYGQKTRDGVTEGVVCTKVFGTGSTKSCLQGVNVIRVFWQNLLIEKRIGEHFSTLGL